ncbi:CU044_2847 family protein [Streptomyces mangrovisoli]|uniref:Trypsin-co-occurring domain-containing protein n=1 Tax=Streptomyces mangrovisoli TaxID=1428628 RepID=A0A1J4NMS0_9ACTN|nr:CU044_2847 family protein [Streptomyces mangrovisoli]OIJ63595.1 hypothetical protein WN71_032745 [Streptomyces mangrovisoli]
MGERIQEIRLPDGTPVLARLTVLPLTPDGASAQGEGEGDGEQYDAEPYEGAPRDGDPRQGGPYEAESYDGEQYDDVGTLDAIAGRVLGLRSLITGIGASVHDAAKAVKPDEISTEFAVELALKPNKAIAAVLADGEAKASLTVTLTWHLGGRDAGGEQGTDA